MKSTARLSTLLFALGLVPMQLCSSANGQTDYPLGTPPTVESLSRIDNVPPQIEVTPTLRSISEASFGTPRPDSEITLDTISILQQSEPTIAMEAPSLQLEPTAHSLAQDCLLEVTEIQPGGTSSLLSPGFSLKLVVPDSVRVVEVVPHSQNKSERTIRLSMGTSNQGPVEQDAQFQTASLPRQVLPAANTTVVQPSMLEQNERFSDTTGYRRNPFYQPGIMLPASRLNFDDSQPKIEQTGAEMSILTPTEATYSQPTNPASDFEVPIAISGPNQLELGVEGEFWVEVHNENSEELDNFSVELLVPSGLQLSVLDRPARVNVEQRTVTWDIETMLPSEIQKIRYKVIATDQGSHSQILTVSKDQSFSASCQLQTNVVAERVAESVAQDTGKGLDAPMLPFESDDQ